MKERRVVIIDDDQAMRKLLRTTLENQGFLTRAFPNAAEGALEIWNTRPDLVILDLDMPAVSGRECLEALRKTALDIPIVIVSAVNTVEEVKRITPLHPDGYILKTSDPKKDFRTLLLKKIEGVLRKKSEKGFRLTNFRK
ncbi:response regulator [Candidatus Poribacteria bacterium]|nr:response regulator [Candidatus Poribacteria bacterium]